MAKARDSVKTIKGIKRYKQSQLLAVGNPTDLAIEAIRSLRTSLHFAMMQAQNNVLMLTGVSPSIGKTFVCANLAAVISQTHKRVLLIDCDMRKGYTHELLGTNNVDGLSDILAGKGEIASCAKPTAIANFDLIPRGQVPPNPSELLMSERFGELIALGKQPLRSGINRHAADSGRDGRRDCGSPRRDDADGGALCRQHLKRGGNQSEPF